jgi:hypothetical protein
MLLMMIGRTPAIMGSIMVGSMLNVGSYFGVAILSAIAIIAFILAVVYRKKIMSWIDKGYDKFTSYD